METLLDEIDLARILATSTRTVNRLVRDGKIPSVDVPGVGKRFRREDVEAWLEELAKREGVQS